MAHHSSRATHRPHLVSPLLWLLLLIQLPLHFSCTREDQPPPREVIRPVKLLRISSEGDVIQRSYPGSVRAARRVDLSFQVGGPLIELLADEGQEVQQGQTLARIDPRNFATDLRNAEGQLARAHASLVSAKSEYDRIMRIRNSDPGAASESMLVKRKEAVDTITADIASLTALVESAKNNLNDTNLKAPFDGIVSRRYVDNFQEIRAQEPILSLDYLGNIEIVVDIPETLMARVNNQRPIDLVAEFAAFPGKRYPLSTKEFSTRADASTQTYQIVLEMERPKDINILPGMTATVTGSTISTPSHTASFVIPAYAITANDNGTAQVWIVDEKNMTVHSRPVTTGSLSGHDSITIKKGLENGDVIAITGVSMLKDGMKIRDLARVEGYGK